MNKVRVRIAPSPTGEDLHIGNAYTALINYVFAKKNNGKFIIRIEDTDRTRLVKGSETRILSSLKWLGLQHDEGPDLEGPFAPYRQSERLKIYEKYSRTLIDKGSAYYCFCSSDRLDELREFQKSKGIPTMYDGKCRKLAETESKNKIRQGIKYTVRLKVPKEGKSVFKDIIRGEISFESKLIDDQILIKSDSFPTYHFAVVVDDYLMEISHIIRGEEWISSVPKHILLYQAFGWKIPQYAHMPLLRNPDKSKLSKRKNPVWVSWYREQGFLPEAVLNYLATLAWSHPSGKDIFSLEEMIKAFKLEDIQTTAPIFDVEKLRWVNGEYLRKKSDEELKELICQYVNTLTRSKHDQILDKIIPLIKDRMKVLSEFQSLAGFLFERPKELERPVKRELLEVVERALKESQWNHDAMEQAIRAAADKAGGKAKDVFMELRVAVTGKTVGPPLLESLEILGKEETLTRIGSSAGQSRPQDL